MVTGDMAEACRDLIILNKLGLHLRPIRLLVDVANAFSADIVISEGDRTVNGKSFLEVMSMAVPQNTKLTFRAVGDDAEAAIAAFEDLIEGKFNEE